MRPLPWRDIDKPTPMHIDPIPGILTKHLEQNLGPLFLRLFLGHYELQIKGEAEIELMHHTTFLSFD